MAYSRQWALRMSLPGVCHPHDNLMISRRIWNAIKRPPRVHPLFRYVAADSVLSPGRSISSTAVFFIVLLLTVAALISREFSSALSLIIFLTIPLLVANFVFTGPIYGLRWAMRSGQAVATLRRLGSYDLLCLTPPGALNINWLTCTAVLHRHIGTTLLQSQSLWPGRMFLVLPLVIFLSIQANVVGQPGLNTLVMSLYLLLTVVWFYLEDIQSMALGGLLGMLIPTYTSIVLEVNLLTIMVYLLVQLPIYLLVVVLLHTILPAIYTVAGFEGWLADISRPALVLTMLFGLREGILWLLWHHLAQRLHIERKLSLITGWRV